jgi:outer membrane protein assembly factor BamB
MRYITWTFLLAATMANAAPIGWRNDGFGNFPDATPPTEWKTPRWKVDTANWGNSSPIVVGDRIYVISEPVTGYAPILQCLSLDTGKELWRREVDHAPFLPVSEKEREAVARDFKALRELVHEVNQAKHGRGWVETKRATEPDHPLVKEHDAIVAKYGITFEERAEGGKQKLHPKLPPPPKGLEARWRELAEKYNAWQGSWVPTVGIRHGQYEFREYAGWTHNHPTPLWDGRQIVVLTGQNSVAAYAPDGKLNWHVVLASPDIKRKSGNLCFVHNSPMLVEGKIIIQSGDFLRGLDPATGKELWREPLPNMDKLCHWKTSQFVPVEVEATWHVVAHNGALHRVRDGKLVNKNLLGSENAKTPACLGQTIGVKDGILYLDAYGGAAGNADVIRALKLKKTGADEVNFDLLWQKPGTAGAGYGASAVIARGRIWGATVYELATGEKSKERGISDGSHEGIDFCFVGERYIVAGNGEKKPPIYVCHDLETGKRNTMTLGAGDPNDPDRMRRRWRDGGWWAGAGWGGMFFAGNNAVVRVQDTLYCLTSLKPPILSPSAQAISNQFGLAEKIRSETNIQPQD